jgi:hypothetical protein
MFLFARKVLVDADDFQAGKPNLKSDEITRSCADPNASQGTFSTLRTTSFSGDSLDTHSHVR